MTAIERTEWLAQVGEHTVKHRTRRAAAIRRRGRQRQWELRIERWTEPYVTAKIQWHERRAVGQEQRIERVLDCGSDVLRILCPGCGQVHERTAGCRIGLLCLRCRPIIAGQKRAAFKRARLAVLESARTRGLLEPRRRGGRFGEKFLTLTTPHLPDDSIGGRITRVLGAWALFLRRLRRWLRERKVKTLHFFRVIEWTPGSDALGHPHLHVWLFTTWLDREEVHGWWRQSLIESGCAEEEARQVIVDLQDASGTDVGSYLIKYMLKDIGPDGAMVEPALFAQVYAALDERRRTQGSRGFFKLAAENAERCECGSTLPREVRRKRRPAEGAEGQDVGGAT